MSVTAPARLALVYITGPGHCGSTLLNLLLNGHSRILGLSEVETIGEHLRSNAGDSVLDDPFWRAVADRYERLTGESFSSLSLPAVSAARIGRLDAAQIEAWNRPNRALFECIAQESGAEVLVDASKSWQRLALLSKGLGLDLRVIHLQRDGRAVYNSYARKYQRPVFALTKWPKFTIGALRLKRRLPSSVWLDLRYEDLAKDPHATLQRVCDFLGLDYEPAMLRYREQPNLGLGGNRMAAASDEAIRLDERWKTELSPGRRLVFGLLFGWLNRKLGYR
ncbi:MAG: sulfotransferase [Thermoanaerobaculia bacterium]